MVYCLDALGPWHSLRRPSRGVATVVICLQWGMAWCTQALEVAHGHLQDWVIVAAGGCGVPQSAITVFPFFGSVRIAGAA